MPAHYLRAAFRGKNNLTGALVVNVIHVEADVLTSPPNYANIADDIATWLAAKWVLMLPVGYTLLDVTVTEETYPGSTPAQGISVRNSQGARTTPDTDLDVGLCQILQLKSATPKRYARGHIFAPPAISSSEAKAGGVWDPLKPYASAVGGFGQQLTPGFSAGSTTYSPIIFSTTQVKKGLTPFVFPVVAAVATPVMHMLHSRQTSP